ncbi:hypothetical protein NEMBOFW57_000469 [Staphylotrichum longicolle]|uniref:DRBM domain-containing protein n=1 Tax=Staphylotrichum longicolle TaxID=669026 RepID=A0AAD4F2S9_9PEZI|nr:hypothetical protein NEMBOFW57_000469 [Staphylotrichum longicolle]
MASNDILNAQIVVSPLDEPVDYRDLKAWIEEQERNPTPLSPLQQRAISDLRRSLEPKLGDCDWVSLLNRFRQANGSPLPAFTDEAVPDERWVNRCHFQLNPDAEPLIFPNPDAGFVTVDDKGAPGAPSFGRKKDAKQYAAKCCIEWLMKGGYMPSDGVNVEFPKTKKPPRAQTTTTTIPTTLPAQAPSNNPTPNTNINTAPVPNQPSPTTSSDDDAVRITHRVTGLCRLLGLVVPQYKITPSSSSSPSTTTTSAPSSSKPSATAAAAATATAAAAITTPNPQFFDGHADFGADRIKVPDGLGRVRNVYGRKNARDKVAEEVLAWLVAEEGRRMREVEGMMAEIEQEGVKV